ncbi:hypothetical protein ACFL1N_06685 [Thermodesulfobacteriota bacterium]
MKRKLLLSSSLMVVMVFILSCILMASAVSDAAASQDRLITVMNPAVTEHPARHVPLASRLNSLEGKTIYLVDMNYEGIGGTPVMGEMQAWFEKNMPGVKTVLKLKKGNYIADDPALWKEIKKNGGDGVIMGVAG